MKEYEFDATILKRGGMDAAFIEFPFDVEQEFGVKGQVKVLTIIDGAVEYRGSLAKMGHRCHLLGVTQAIRQRLGKQPGDVIHVVLREDTELRVVDVPPDFRDLLSRHPEAKAFFETLSYTNKKEYVQWVESAKREETRQARLERSIVLLGEMVRHP